jgi:hypothetical protein
MARHFNQRSCFMSTQPYSPNDLLRLYLRGMLDDHTFKTQAALILIDQAEDQRGIKALMEIMSEELGRLSAVVDAILGHLQLPGLSDEPADEVDPPTA